MRIAAIYTTYHPDAGFRNRIRSVMEMCAVTIVVDNTPGGHVFSSEELFGLTLLQDGVNKGLGAALNVGIEEARNNHCDAVLLFDQDSSPSEEFVRSIIHGLNFAGPKALVGPLLVDDQMFDVKSLPSNSFHQNPTLQDVLCVATSGMCFRLVSLDADDRFTEDFFLDFVDFDWCWRLRKKGWRVFCLSDLPMLHRRGLAQKKFLGLSYNIPPPFRHYFQFRDTLRLVVRAYVPFYSRFRLFVVLFPKLILYPFLLSDGLERLKWMLMGIRDSLLCVNGVGAASQKVQTISK